jgi:uncharacterized protein YjbI with pentapeptide repeats
MIKTTNKIFKTFLRIHSYIIQRPILTTAILLTIISIFVVVLSIPYYVNDFNNLKYELLIQGHGMIFDIGLIGLLLFWLNENGEKQKRIRFYNDEIDDFRTWESPEAAFRTVGNIKRLNRLKVHEINLVNCYLHNTNLNHTNLKGSNLNTSNISNSELIGITLENCRLNQTNFKDSNLNQCNLIGAYASGANFKNALLIDANLKNSFLIKTNFKNAFLMNANLQNSYIIGADFENASLYKADMRGVKGLTIEQLKKSKTIYLTKFDKEFLAQHKDFFDSLID